MRAHDRHVVGLPARVGQDVGRLAAIGLLASTMIWPVVGLGLVGEPLALGVRDADDRDRDVGRIRLAVLRRLAERAGDDVLRPGSLPWLKMITPDAPASCALTTLTAKSQVPRCISAMSPAVKPVKSAVLAARRARGSPAPGRG